MKRQWGGCCALGIVTAGLSGCGGLTQIQDATSKFSRGAHSVSTGEVTFILSERTADCNNQFYNQALNWANRQRWRF